MIIEQSAFDTVEKTIKERKKELDEIMKNGAPEEIRAAMGRWREAVNAQAALIRARYNL